MKVDIDQENIELGGIAKNVYLNITKWAQKEYLKSCLLKKTIQSHLYFAMNIFFIMCLNIVSYNERIRKCVEYGKHTKWKLQRFK